MRYMEWAPYVSVAERRALAREESKKLRTQGLDVQPIEPMRGRTIARTFWGEGWCRHLEQFSDYANRLPRGRRYVRNGSVFHLGIETGRVHARVVGNEFYEVDLRIKTMPKGKWDYIRKSCTGRIGSLLELLQGRFSDEVMRVVSDRDDGLFPLPGEMTFECSCPDWAVMCKHVAAVLYGVGARLDASPELLFRLRGVDHEELIGGEAVAAATAAGRRGGRRRRVKGDLSALFGVKVEGTQPPGSGAHADDAASGAVQRFVDRITGAAVRRVFDEAGLSKKRFAAALGVSGPCVDNWMRRRGRLHLRARSRRGFERLAGGDAADVAPAENADTARVRGAFLRVAAAEEQQRSSRRAPSTRNAKERASREKTARGRPGRKTECKATSGTKAAASAKTKAKRKRGRKAKAKARPEARRKAASVRLTGRAVARLRARLGLSKAALGRRLGVTGQTIGNWERKRGRLNLRAAAERELRALLASG